MIRKITIAAIILLATTQFLFSQSVKLKTIGAIYPPTLSQEDKEKVLEVTERAINDYIDAFTLLDKNQNRVTSESVNRFRALFGGTATLVKDYEEYVPSDLVTVEEYFNGVFNRMELEGVQVRLNDATVLEIKDDGLFWVAVIKAEKDFYNYVTANTNEVKTIGGRIMDQEIRFDIPKSDFDLVKIAKISKICRPGEKCDQVVGDYSRYIGLSFGAFTPVVVNKTYGGYLGSSPSNGELELANEFSFSGGIEFFTNRINSKEAEGKHLFLISGVRFNYNIYKAELNGYNFSTNDIAGDSIGGGQAYLRKGVGIEATEELTIASIEIPVGLGFRLKQKQNWELLVQAKVLPSYSLLLGTGSLNSTGDYDAIIDAANWRLLRDQAAKPDAQSANGDKNLFNNKDTYAPFLGGEERDATGTPEPDLNWFGLAAQLSPVVIFHLGDNNPNWSLLIGADLTYQFSSFFKYAESQDILLKYPNDDDYSKGIENDLSLSQHYLKSMSVLNAGLRIGLLHRFVSKP